MSEALAKRDETAILEKVVIGGDLKELSSAERVAYYRTVCESVGVNPFTQPFSYITLNGKLTLYANKSCTDQLRSLRKISAAIVNRERVDDVYVVTARATTPDGRTDESIGAVTIGQKKGDDLANALMKAETKAKRRVTLSISGLSMLDETEIETIRDARPVPVDVAAYPSEPVVIEPATDLATGERFPSIVESYAMDIKAAQSVAELLKVYAKFMNDLSVTTEQKEDLKAGCSNKRHSLEHPEA